MGSDKPKKSCFNCTKRRIICDLSLPTCQKCAKKGLECPGYGVRYRFASGQTVPSSVDIGRTQASSAAAPTRSTTTTNQKRKRNLKWLDVAGGAKGRVRRGAGSSSTISTSSTNSSLGLGEGQPPSSSGTGSGRDDDNGAVVDTAGPSMLVRSPMFNHESDPRGQSPVVVQTESDHDDDKIRDQVVETTKDGQLMLSEAPAFTMSLFNPTPLLLNPHPRMRYLFHHFSTHVSPVMLMYDDEANGYRHQILPLALADPTVERAVCVAAAFHLSRRQPELSLAAEGGRAAIISKLSETSSDLSDATWANIILLIVTDLITGHEDVISLYKMLVKFLNARAQATGCRDLGGDSPLTKFLYFQSRVISFFAVPILGESQATRYLSQMLRDPECILEQLASGPNASFPPVSFAGRNTTSSQSLMDARTRIYEIMVRETTPIDARTQLYVTIFREATEIYLIRANATEQVEPALSAPSSSAAFETCASAFASTCDSIAPRLAHLRKLFEQVDSSAPGSHTVVWPSFVAAAESRSEDDKEFFTAILRRIWDETSYANVLRALDALPVIWEKQSLSHNWTAALPDLKTVVM